MKDHANAGKSTIAIHAGQYIEKCFGAVAPPIYQTSTFAFKSTEEGRARFAGEEDGYIYTRMGNPTIKMLEDNVAAMEGGFGGLATASGMAAVNTIYFGLLGAGDHMISTRAVYGPSRSVMVNEYSRFGVESSHVDTSDLEAIKAAIKPNTKLLYIETPANPTIQITDIAACAEIAHQHNMVLAVDNTFCSPHLQNPLALGADIVFHSTTKFLNGHSDCVGGIIITKTEELFKRLQKVLWGLGGTMDPHQAWMILRGTKTLGMRVEQGMANAKVLAKFLEDHPKIEWVRYPGLESHPQYDLAQKQMLGPGALISFGVKGGIEAGRTLLDNMETYHPGSVSGRHRIPDSASRQHDPCLRAQSRPGRSRYHRWSDSSFRWLRKCGRPPGGTDPGSGFDLRLTL